MFPKHWQAPKKTKKNKVKIEKTSTGTKKNKKKKRNFQELWAHFWVVAGNFVFFFFWCLSMFGASSGLVFLVFVGACQCFVKSESPNLHRHQKNKNQSEN